MKLAKWEAGIPQTPSNKNRKRCYRLWRKIGRLSAGGKIVWITDKEKTFYQIKHSKLKFKEESEEIKLL